MNKDISDLFSGHQGIMSDEFPAPHFFKTIKNKTDTCVLTIKTDLATAEKVVALVVEEHKLENGSSIA